MHALAVFSAKNIFSGQVGSKEVRLVLGLEPGESRIITAHIHGLAQWTLISSQVKVSRLGTHDAWGLGTVTRDKSVLFFPWFVALVVALLITGAWWRQQRKKYHGRAGNSDNDANSLNSGNGGNVAVEVE